MYMEMKNALVFAILCSSVEIRLPLAVNKTAVCRKDTEEGASWIKCCPGYKLNNNDECIECPLGTYGENCKELCEDGYYGLGCTLQCHCSTNERCDKEIGCRGMEHDCPLGTYGQNCKELCEDGYYGLRCKLRCNCTTNERCDKEIGCGGLENGKENSQVLQPFVLYGLLCFVSVVIIFILSFIIKKKVVCSKNRIEETTNTRNNDMDDGYEMIDDILINPNIIPQHESGRITTSAISVEKNDTVRREYLQPISDNNLPSSVVYSYAGNGVPVVRDNAYLQPISENYHSSSDNDVSVGDCVPVVRSNDYLHPYNPLLPDWKSFTPLYNDEELNIKSDGYLNPYQPLQENWLQRTHVYHTAAEHTSSDDKLSADQLKIDQTFDESVQNDKADENTLDQ